MKVDLACGQRKREGFTGVDAVALPGVDVVHDLTIVPWPFDTASVEEVACSHFFEHLTGAQRLLFMDELFRILPPGGKATVIVPYYSSMRAVQDPTHQWPPVCEASFLYFNKNWRTENALDHYPIQCDFDYGYNYLVNPNTPFQIHLRPEEARNFGIGHYLNVVADLHVFLTRR